MSEKLSGHESYHSSELAKKGPEKSQKPKGEQAPEEKKLSLEKIRRQVELEEEASREAAEEHNLSESKPKDDAAIPAPSLALKQNMRDRALTKIQKELPPVKRVMSRVIHQPVVEKISEVAAKTIVRPTIMLCGGLAALIGGLFLLYFSKHYHFKYNFFAFLLFFAAGVVIGIVLEIIIFFFHSKKSRHSSHT